ncbi:ribonuclease H-like domain-containing protein [Tanacetum coccineum]
MFVILLIMVCNFILSSTTQLSAYTDADWVGCPVTSRFTSGYCVFLGDNLVSWSAKCQVYCDNVIAVYMSANPVQHQRMKHIEIDIHFVRDFVASGQVRVLHVPSRFQYADIFTKGLPTALFIEFRSSLNMDVGLSLRSRPYSLPLWLYVHLSCPSWTDSSPTSKRKVQPQKRRPSREKGSPAGEVHPEV